MKKETLKNKSVKELAEAATTLRKQLAEAAVNARIKPDHKVRVIRGLKRDLARVLTMVRAQELAPASKEANNG